MSKSNIKDIDNISNSYSQEALIPVVSFGNTENFNTLMAYINDKFLLEYIRTFENNSLPYCVYKLKEGGLLFIFFHGDFFKFADCAFVVKDSLSKSSFDSIKQGKTLADVEKTDSGLKLNNSVHSEDLSHMQAYKSYHMIKEGFLIITYKNDGTQTIESYNPSSFVVESIDYVSNGGILMSNNIYTVIQNDYPD